MTTFLNNLRPLTIALMLASVALGTVIVWRVWHGTEVNALLATPARKYAPPEVKLSAPDRQANLAIRDHALFHASREFFMPPTPVATPATPPRPDYRLVGTFIIPRKPTVALLVSATGGSRKVHPGDDLDGWRVQAVESRRVVLQFDSESMEIVSATRAAAGGMTMAPLSRAAPSIRPAVPTVVSLGNSESATPTALRVDEATPAKPGSVKVLGSDAPSQGGMREASASTNPIGSDARLYRPPPQ